MYASYVFEKLMLYYRVKALTIEIESVHFYIERQKEWM